jgi:hypothetical protein
MKIAAWNLKYNLEPFQSHILSYVLLHWSNWIIFLHYIYSI